MNKPHMILEMVRSGGTMRFHAQAGITLKTQDVAQHSYGVFWFVYALTGGAASAALLVAAMSHDAGERWVGDVPAPTKRAIDGLSKTLNAHEEAAVLKRTGFKAPELSSAETAILKLADCLDGAAFCEHEILLGNTLMRRVLNNFLSYAESAYDDRYVDLHGDGQMFCPEIFTSLVGHFRRV